MRGVPTALTRFLFSHRLASIEAHSDTTVPHELAVDFNLLRGRKLFQFYRPTFLKQCFLYATDKIESIYKKQQKEVSLFLNPASCAIHAGLAIVVSG